MNILLLNVIAWLLSCSMLGILAQRKAKLVYSSHPPCLFKYYFNLAFVRLSVDWIIIIFFNFITDKILSTSSTPGFLLIILIILFFRGYFLLSKITHRYNALIELEKTVKKLFFSAAFVAVSITLFTVISILIESIRFFTIISPLDFLFGLKWSPQNLAHTGYFGAIPVFTGTLLIALISMIVAVPLGLLSAIYLSEYSKRNTRNIVKPLLEILAGIPTVVYGYFAAINMAPFIRNLAEKFGMDIASESALAAGLVMGIMIVPFILSLSEDIISSVPQNIRDASLALGATKSETIIQVVLPAALPGLISAILLAFSRAIGETMIVTMAAGLQANLTFNPFAPVTTVTAQIVALVTGDQEFDSPKTLAAFALALTLFIITLMINILALTIIKRYKKRYE